MKKEVQNFFTSIISINPYKNEYFSSSSNFISLSTSPEYSKEQLSVSYLNTQSYINHQLEMSRNIPDEDIYDAIHMQIYDELGLDQTIEYQIQYIETNFESDNRHFQVFVVDPLEIIETYQDSVDKIKYIDEITPTPLLIKSIYSKKIIEEDGIHCFIYFQENDSFATIYKDKEFVYSKSLRFSLLQMHERFCELYGERVEYEDFIKFLTTQNLKNTTSDYKKHIFKLHKEIFANVNDILTYAKKAFNIEKVEQIFIGSQVAFASNFMKYQKLNLVSKQVILTLIMVLIKATYILTKYMH